MRASLLTIGLLALVALSVVSLTVVEARSHSHHHEVKESISSPPAGWTAVRRASPSAPLRLLIAVRQQNLHELEQTLLDVSDPRSSSFGQHWSNEAIHALVAPKMKDVTDIHAWLQGHGIDSTQAETTSNSDFIRVRVTVGEAEKLLHAEYFEFAHPARKDTMIRTLSYKVPSSIAHAIDIIGPTVRFPSATKPKPLSVEERLRTERQMIQAAKDKKHRKIRNHSRNINAVRNATPKPDPSICLAGPSTLSTTPACLRALYAVGDYAAVSGTNSSVGVSAFEGQYFSSSDLSMFFSTYDAKNARAAITVGQNVDDPNQAGTESSLDIQYSMAMAPGEERFDTLRETQLGCCCLHVS